MTLVFRGLWSQKRWRRNRHSEVSRKRAFQKFLRGRHGGVEKRGGVENLTNDAPKKGFWTPPLVWYVFHPAQVSVLCFPVQDFTTEQTRSSFGGVQNFRESAFSGRFSSPHTVCTPPHITAQISRIRFLEGNGQGLSVLKRCVPKTLAFAFGLRLRSTTRCFKTRVLRRRLPNGKPQERLRFRALRSKTLAFKNALRSFFCDLKTSLGARACV